MTKEEIIQYFKEGDFSEISREEVLNHLFQNGEITLANYLELQKYAESMTEEDVWRKYALQGIQIIDTSRTYILKPSIIDIEVRSLKWYQKIWRDIYYWEGWFPFKLVILLLLEGISIGILLHWFKYI